jgi:hypothetical protein
MCIVVDTNAMSNVFNSKDSMHLEFLPVYDWIINGRGKLVFGGSEYRKELKNLPRYLFFLKILGDLNKCVVIDNELVDSIDKDLKKTINDKKCDDSHLIAIIISSGCRLICTSDISSYKYVKRPDLYPKGCNIPLYYTSSTNSKLLNEKNIVEKCKPCVKLTKREKQLLTDI